jgi:hypothetical protein
MRGADYSIPVGTAFSLSGIGSDPDTEDVLTLRNKMTVRTCKLLFSRAQY